MFVDLDDFTLLSDDNIFQISKLPLRSYEKDDYTQMDVTFEMNLDKKHVIRNMYGILDLLSDVGGIMGIMMSFFAFLAGIFNFKNFDNYMASRLFKIEKLEAKSTHISNYFNRSEFIKTKRYNNCREYFVQKLYCVGKTRRLTRKREWRAMDLAR